MTKKDTKNGFVLKAKNKHGEEEYDYSLVEYVDNHTKVKIICKRHGIFEQKPNNHLNGQGCFKCSVDIKSKKNITFIKEAKQKHGENKYDYSLVNYINSHTKVIIICKIHGPFEQYPMSHLRGKGCFNCYGCSKKELNKVIEDFKDKHGDLYDYSLVEYVNNHTKIKIICKKHGIFEQLPSSHLNGAGCIKCSINAKKNLEEVVKNFTNIHGDLYDYSLVEYVNNHTKVKIICKKHGMFEQKPNCHLRGHGCPNCSTSISNMSQKWLDSLNNNNIIRERIIQVKERIFIVDGIDFTSNTIYEFYGDFWHGNLNKFKENEINPRTKCSFGELNKKTLDRENFLKLNGFNIISVWESDFKKEK